MAFATPHEISNSTQCSSDAELHGSLGGLGYMVLPYRVQVSLLVAQVLAAATLLRSIAYDRWVTVLAAALIVAGTMAAQRGRTWGVVLAFAVSAWFPVAFFIGIAPVWFLVVGVAAAWPFMQLWRSFARFDRGATTTLAALATSLGVAGALTWKSIAFPLMTVFPALIPSPYANNGLAVLGALGVLAAIVASRRKLIPDAVPDRARLAEPVRFAEVRDDRLGAAEAELEHEESTASTGLRSRTQSR